MLHRNSNGKKYDKRKATLIRDTGYTAKGKRQFVVLWDKPTHPIYVYGIVTVNSIKFL